MNHTIFRGPLHRLFSALLVLLSLICTPAAAQQPSKTTVIRDTEIETMLKDWTDPVIRAAQLNPDSVRFILVENPGINAFVAGGPNIFIFTGLLLKSKSADEIVGVIAHELGHIRGGHLVRARGAMQNASYESIIGTILGIGAAVLTGEGALGQAIVAGSRGAAINNYLAFSRVQESSADQSALDSLEKAHMSPAGLLSFMEKLEGDELLPTTQQNEYVRTHPLTRDRVEAVKAGLARSAYKNASPPKEWDEQHQRMIAKLTGFITPEQVAWTYDSRDTSVAASYARAIAAYRRNRVEEALAETDGLLAREPENPYFLELKGQMLVEFGKVGAALPFYSKALNILPDAALIRIAHAHALIESAGDDSKKLHEAIDNLERAGRDEPRSSYIQRLLATAYGRLGQEPEAKLHLAEEALLKGELPYAKRQAQAAQAGLEKGSRSWLKAQDILNAIEQAGEKD